MVFINALALFVGWVFLIALIGYLTLSLAISAYAFVFWYRKWPVTRRSKILCALRTGFKNLWWWLRGLVSSLYSVFFIRYLRSLECSVEEIAEHFEVSTDMIEELESESYKEWWYPFDFVRDNKY
ncbi:MAG: hypothetical protein NT098_05635 [Candidatus Parcubacteria bacterium]|nr:hypothetical protein [Candidatus Parcubacteria bacterium]